jgi:PAS domain S-box-containing protein
MRWPSFEQSAFARYALALCVAALAACAHWSFYPVLHGRVPFLLFLPSVILVTAIAGRGPGLVVVIAGLLNATFQLPPTGSMLVYEVGDRFAVSIYVVTASLLVFLGDRVRLVARRQFQDINDLHDLSAAVAATSDLEEQLRLILRTLTRMHGTDRGLIYVYDAASNVLRLKVSLGFSDAVMGRLDGINAAQSPSGRACIERTRVVVEDVSTDPSVAEFQSLAMEAGIRAVHSTPLLSRSGEVLGAISVHLREPRRPTAREISLADICATKASVAIQRAAAEDLAYQRERRFRTVLESSAVAFTILEPVRNDAGAIVDFRWSYVNAAAEKILRHEAKDLLGRRIRDVLPATWDDTDLFEDYVRAINENAVCERELHSAANGSDGWFQIIASPLDGMLAIWFADITERKRQEETLREADKRKDEFLATLAHELPNPLAPIGQAALIADSDRASDSQKRWSYSVIERQVQHMSLLLDDLLDVSRITRGTLYLRKQVVQLGSVISAAVETARPLIDSRHHQLLVDIPETQRLCADPLRLSQVVANLLTNAAKYTEPGGRIRLVATTRDRMLTIRIEDTGIGLLPQHLQSIFEMFSQVRTTPEHSHGGLGIGLALTRGLVEMHSGTIEATSAGPGHGSVFTIRLPIGEVGEAPSPAFSERRARLALSRRVLIADDNRDAADSLAMLLRLEGHEVFVAHDGETALRLFEESQPQVALLDIGMPELDGYEVARRIRAKPAGKSVLLIAITGWGQEKDRRKSVEAGFDHHVTKPVEPEAVLKLINVPARATGAR